MGVCMCMCVAQHFVCFKATFAAPSLRTAAHDLVLAWIWYGCAVTQPSLLGVMQGIYKNETNRAGGGPSMGCWGGRCATT